MDISQLIEVLSKPNAYPFPVESIEVRQTHISAVFLAGSCVYKVKKPVNPGFLDFTTLESRRHFCEEEVRLNRRLAPEVYLGVVPVVREYDALKFEGKGEVVEWAVKMRRLPDQATLLEQLHRDKVAPGVVRDLAERIASFHQQSESSERIASNGRFELVSRQIMEVFDRAEAMIGTTVSPAVFYRTKSLSQQTLSRFRDLIVKRAERHIPRDCHGDLHLDHIYFFPDKKAPANIVIIDCIEFNEQFRFIDPVADMAFTFMDFEFHGRRDLARIFADAYFAASGDSDGRLLLPLYTSYRATVRGMVEGLELAEAEISKAEKSAAIIRARAHWLLALSESESPSRKPCLLLVAGLPGTGKSTLAHRLAESAGFNVIRSDVVRKELASIPINERAPDSLYAHEWTERTYAECLRRVESGLFEGERIIVDATFREEKYRKEFLQAAVRFGVPAAIMICESNPQTVRRRLEARKGDASDADWSVYQHVAATWENLSESVRQASHVVNAEGAADQMVNEAFGILRQMGLVQ